MSSLWLTEAVQLLSTPDCVKALADPQARERFADRVQQQAVLCGDRNFLHGRLKEIAGGIIAFRGFCEQAHALLYKALQIKLPFLGIKPHEKDHPEVQDRWNRARERREEESAKLGKLLGEAGEILRKAEAIALKALNPKEAEEPNALELGAELRRMEKAVGKSK